MKNNTTYFPLIKGLEINPKTNCMVLNIHLLLAFEETAHTVCVFERNHRRDKIDLSYNFSIDDKPFETLKEFLENPESIAGVTMLFHVKKEDVWFQVLARHHSLFAKKLYLETTGFKVSLHSLEEDLEPA